MRGFNSVCKNCIFHVFFPKISIGKFIVSQRMATTNEKMRRNKFQFKNMREISRIRIIVQDLRQSYVKTFYGPGKAL